MPIKRVAWIIVGVFLWGIPTGIMFSAFAAMLNPQSFFEMQPFNGEIFFKSLYRFVPLFTVLGVLLGLILAQMTRQKSE